ncbi:hypothetical protein B9T62_09540 [Paenibacillus donghaensis]|uniref:Uncharacterized protein n=1 Tax=Paenibacillus donghaensis TaxID=414771 RepID=A0A2Z2K7H8_9BACL|nr:hypothetical protein B9T62_09540 [Paenibacillus donghaensis]
MGVVGVRGTWRSDGSSWRAWYLEVPGQLKGRWLVVRERAHLNVQVVSGWRAGYSASSCGRIGTESFDKNSPSAYHLL